MIAPPADELDRGHLRIAAAMHVVLGIVAPHEQPPGSPRSFLTFRELGLDPATAPGVDGFAAGGLDRIAADITGDDRYVGRPTFAVGLERVIADHATEADDGRLVIRWRAAQQEARVLACHEYAHAILTARDKAAWRIDRETIGPALCGVADIPPGHEHGPAWWKLYCMMVARAAMRCPRLIDWHAFGDDVAAYRYGSPVDAGRWIAAAQVRGLFNVPLIETLDLPMPAFDDLVHELYVPPSAGTLPAAA